MTELKLVPTHEPTELERLLLSAASSEKPSDEHKLRVREALGLALPLAALPATAASAGAKTAAGTSATAGTSSSVGTVALAKALVGGVVSASAVGAVVFALVTPSKAPAPVAPAPAQVQAAPVNATPAAPVAAPQETAVSVSELPLAKDEPKVKSVREQKPVAASTSEDDLRQQIVLIEAARAHVAQNNPWPALQALDTYTAKFKGGSFDQEAAVLRIKAVEQTGDRERASGLAKSFLEKNPTSPHVDRVRRVAEPAEPR
jgi:hypothetical protein